jgi:hypothetical protein
VARGQSGGGAPPASERGGGGGGERWRAILPVRVFQMDRGRERVRRWAWCLEVERAGATGVHAVSGVGMRPPCGVGRLRAVRAACPRAGGRRKRAAWA